MSSPWYATTSTSAYFNYDIIGNINAYASFFGFYYVLVAAYVNYVRPPHSVAVLVFPRDEDA